MTGNLACPVAMEGPEFSHIIRYRIVSASGPSPIALARLHWLLSSTIELVRHLPMSCWSITVFKMPGGDVIGDG